MSQNWDTMFVRKETIEEVLEIVEKKSKTPGFRVDTSREKRDECPWCWAPASKEHFIGCQVYEFGIYNQALSDVKAAIEKLGE